jgi:hypothetical protein
MKMSWFLTSWATRVEAGEKETDESFAVTPVLSA